MDTAILAALIGAAGAIIAAATGAVIAAKMTSRHKQPDPSTSLPPLPPLEPYKSAGPSSTASTTTVAPGSRTAPGVSGVHNATVKFAGFWVRLLAGLIDVVLVVFSSYVGFVIAKNLLWRGPAAVDEDILGVFGGRPLCLLRFSYSTSFSRL
jgi:hypothetical protein